MNVSELYSLTEWIQQEIITIQILEKYQALYNILQQHTQPNQPKKSFDKQKNVLVEAVKNVPLQKINKDQIAFLDKLGIEAVVGDKAIEAIEDILFRNVLDVATAAQKLKELFKPLPQGIQKSEQIRQGLTGCVVIEDCVIDSEVLIRVYFEEDTAIANVKDFKYWGNAWYDIGRGIAMVHNSAPEDVKIVGASQGSVVITITVAGYIARTVSKIILDALTISEKCFNIRKLAAETRNLQLRNTQLEQDINQEAEKEKETGVATISDSLVAELRLEENGDGDKITALRKSVEKLIDFVDRGGEVDFVLPEIAEDDSDGVEETPDFSDLKLIFQDIRILENKLKALDYKKFDEQA